MRPYVFALSGVVFLGGCASINSTPATKATDGLVYFLPKKDVLLTVVRSTDARTSVTATTVSVASTAAYPDLKNAYAISFNRNLVGKNTLKVGVSSTGLLTSSKSTSSSGLTDALKNLVESASMLAGPGLAALPGKPLKTCGDGTYTFLYSVEVGPKADACGLNVTITRVGELESVEKDSLSVTATGSRSGIFYRQEEAFKVTVKGDSVNVSTIVLSPSLSPTRFLPVSGSLFSSNDADYEFVDGMPKKYDQEADGELVALLKLPAEVIGAYFGAVGKLFDSFKTKDQKEADLLVAATKTELAKKKYDACIDAIKNRNDALIAQLECNK